MKKVLLSLALALSTVGISFGQGFVQAPDNSGFTFDCDETSGTGFATALYLPNCAYAFENGGGGTDNAPVNEFKFGWGQTDPGYVFLILELTTPLDLSNASHQRLKVTLRSMDGPTPLPLDYTLRLENDGNTNPILDPIPLAVTGTNQEFDLDLSAYIVDGANLSNVKKIIFHYDRCPSGTSVTNGDLFVSNFLVGSGITTSTTKSSAIAESNLFPNPTTGSTTITAELKSTSNVRVVLMNMLGQEVQLITEGNTNSINASFETAALNKGIYSVVYQIDGVTAKSELLVVR